MPQRAKPPEAAAQALQAVAVDTEKPVKAPAEAPPLEAKVLLASAALQPSPPALSQLSQPPSPAPSVVQPKLGGQLPGSASKAVIDEKLRLPAKEPPPPAKPANPAPSPQQTPKLHAQQAPAAQPVHPAGPLAQHTSAAPVLPQAKPVLPPVEHPLPDIHLPVQQPLPPLKPIPPLKPSPSPLQRLSISSLPRKRCSQEKTFSLRSPWLCVLVKGRSSWTWPGSTNGF